MPDNMTTSSAGTPVATPTILLNNGVEMPALGIGVFQIPDKTTEAVVGAALESGYRSIDTAAIYGNEHGVGRAIARSGLPRAELFVTTKLWNADHDYRKALFAYEASLERLGLDYVDLYLVHWPAPARGLYTDAWRALHEIYDEGRVRAIGVSNFLPHHLADIARLGLTEPAVNQIEVHPAFQQRAVQLAGTRRGTITEAWSPLAHSFVLQDPRIERVARKHGRTPAQVVLRWHLQQGRIAIPKSVRPERITSNYDVFDFQLTQSDMDEIDALDSGGRIGPDPDLLN